MHGGQLQQGWGCSVTLRHECLSWFRGGWMSRFWVWGQATVGAAGPRERGVTRRAEGRGRAASQQAGPSGPSSCSFPGMAERVKQNKAASHSQGPSMSCSVPMSPRPGEATGCSACWGRGGFAPLPALPWSGAHSCAPRTRHNAHPACPRPGVPQACKAQQANHPALREASLQLWLVATAGRLVATTGRLAPAGKQRHGGACMWTRCTGAACSRCVQLLLAQGLPGGFV